MGSEEAMAANTPIKDASSTRRSSGAGETREDMSSRISSPYFPTDADAQISRSSESESKHFASSQSLAAQSVLTMAPVCLEANQFMKCEVFAERYRALQRKLTRTDSQTIIQHSARHLCNHGCFFWAFAPVREWHGLREAVRALSGCPPDRILTDWTCVLVHEGQGNASTATSFQAPDGERFGSAAAALRKLNLTGSSTSRRVKKSRITATTRSITALGSSASASRKKRKICEPEVAPSRIPRRLSTCNLLDNKDSANVSNELKEHAAWSPFGLLEELFADDPWKLLLSTILLNRTTRRQVDSVLHDFLIRWPTAKEAAAADVSDVLNIVTPLGIKHRRSNGIIQFSKEYVQLVKSKSSRHFAESGIEASATGINDESKGRVSAAAGMELEDDEILGLYGCGRYGLCAYKIFIRGNLDGTVHDHALHYYVDYKRAAST